MLCSVGMTQYLVDMYCSFNIQQYNIVIFIKITNLILKAIEDEINPLLYKKYVVQVTWY